MGWVRVSSCVSVSRRVSVVITVASGEVRLRVKVRVGESVTWVKGGLLPMLQGRK